MPVDNGAWYYISMSRAKSWFYERPRRDGKREPELYPTEKKTPSVKWRKQYKCKKNKGDHTYKVVSVHNYFRYEGYKEWNGRMCPCSSGQPFENATQLLCSDVKWECSGCHKHAREWFNHWLRSKWQERDHRKMDAYRPGY